MRHFASSQTSSASQKLLPEWAIPQSAVSKIIIDLERECGATLFERSRSGVQITAEGLTLLPAAREVVAAQQSFETRVAEVHNLDSGLIRIGTISSIATHWLPKIIAAFQTDYPGIRYELFLGDYEELEARWQTGASTAHSPDCRPAIS